MGTNLSPGDKFVPVGTYGTNGDKFVPVGTNLSHDWVGVVNRDAAVTRLNPEVESNESIADAPGASAIRLNRLDSVPFLSILPRLSLASAIRFTIRRGQICPHGDKWGQIMTNLSRRGQMGTNQLAIV